MPELNGRNLGRYRILEQIGEGGMATVYRAYDPQLEREVAVKVIRRAAFPEEQFDRILRRFGREAKTLSRLAHPGIVAILDLGEHEGTAFLVLEYLPGGTLKDRLGKPMPWQEAVKLLLPVAQALAYAHAHGIIHRDIKPSNILLSSSGQPLLTDFGIAKLLEAEETQTLTSTGASIGTPEYMAPEQGLGGEVDARADIYSLGIVFYELITGRRPFSADTPLAVIVKHINEPLPPPTAYVPGLPAKVEEALRQALAKKPAERFQTMDEFVRVLEGLQGRGTRSKTTAPTDRATSPNTLATLIQAETQLTRLQDQADAGEPSATSDLKIQPTAPARRVWWPWALAGGGLVLLGCIVVAAVLGGSLIWTSSGSGSSPVSARSETATRDPVAQPTATRIRATATRSGGDSNPTSVQTGCPGAPLQQIEVGDHVYVCTLRDTVAMRAGPGRSYEVLHRMIPGAEFEVIGGPVCADDWSWWQVRSTTSGYEGWMSEGAGDAVDPYYLCPGYP